MANPFRDYLELRNNSGAAFGVGVTEHSLNNVMQRATERDRYLGADSFQCALQGVQAHSAPGAGHVGNKVDAHR